MNRPIDFEILLNYFNNGKAGTIGIDSSELDDIVPFFKSLTFDDIIKIGHGDSIIIKMTPKKGFTKDFFVNELNSIMGTDYADIYMTYVRVDRKSYDRNRKINELLNE